jgi:hypothetical protein
MSQSVQEPTRRQSSIVLTRNGMLTNPEPDRKIEELTDDQVYAAIRYLEAAPKSASRQSDDTATSEVHVGHGVVIYLFLCVAVLGCLAAFWLDMR